MFNLYKNKMTTKRKMQICMFFKPYHVPPSRMSIIVSQGAVKKKLTKGKPAFKTLLQQDEAGVFRCH